jgi:uncharacterized integral membrane protein
VSFFQPIRKFTPLLPLTAQERKMKSYIKALGLIIILLFLVTFGIQNNQLVQLKYYFNYRTIEFPIYLLAYGCATIGVFIGMLIGIVNRLHQRKKIKVLTKLNTELKAKVEKEKQEEVKSEGQKSAAEATEEKMPEDKEIEKKADETQLLT